MAGIRMSISTTSGRKSRAPLERVDAVDGLADHLDVRLCFQDEPESAADEGLIWAWAYQPHDADNTTGWPHRRIRCTGEDTSLGC
jgi:hypothetical protein